MPPHTHRRVSLSLSLKPNHACGLGLSETEQLARVRPWLEVRKLLML